MELYQPPFAQPGPEYRITSELFSISYKGCEKGMNQAPFQFLSLGHCYQRICSSPRTASENEAKDWVE